MTHHKNVILGAGLAGLSTSYHLQEESFIYERSFKPGGLANSVKIDGFLFDLGIHILYTPDPYATDFIKGLLKDNLLIQKREAYIFHGKYDLYTKFPFQSHLNGLPTSVIFDCLKEFAHNLINNNDSNPHNYQEWLIANFGKGIAEHLLLPYSKKLWGFDLEKMNYSWNDHRVPEANLEAIIEGALTETPKLDGFNTAFWYPHYGGMEALPSALAKKVNNIFLNMKATKIFPKEQLIEFNGEVKVHYERLISTLPLPDFINLIDGVPANIRQAAHNLEYNSIICVNLGIDRSNISPYQWLYFYEEDFIFHRISFPMNLSPKTAPEGKSSVSCEISFSKHQPLNPTVRNGIINRTIKDLVRSEILKKDDKIVVSALSTIKYGYVIYDFNHRENVSLIHSYLRSLNIFPCGRYGEWEYFNMDHTILSGKRIADELNL